MYVNLLIYHTTYAKKYIIGDNNNAFGINNKIVRVPYRFRNHYNNYNLYSYYISCGFRSFDAAPLADCRDAPGGAETHCSKTAGISRLE